MKNYKLILILLISSILFFGCTSNQKEKCIVPVMDQIEKYQGILFNGHNADYLSSAGAGTLLADGVFLNEETGEILEFFTKNSVIKIVPEGEEVYIYGGTYIVGETNLEMTFYANNELYEIVSYTYKIEEFEEEGYYLLAELYLTDEEGKTVKYIQPQKLPAIEWEDD